MEDKSDGLEIVSIGKLYSGPWDKKYWSSSRGKDRYPYPVGYKALRNRNGVSYKLEVLEGLKGPLFTVSSTDGQSTSGQTPDIAWECFQKKGYPRIKSLPGKRFSCKIDGVEVFGFKNPFVQRLLRELVADVNEAAEKLPPTSSFSNSVALETNNQSQCIVSSAYPNLLLHEKKSQITGKRSRREKIMSDNSRTNTGLKKHRHQDKNYNPDASHSTGKNPEPRSSLKAVQESMRLESIVQKEENQVAEENASHLVPSNINDCPKLHDLFSQDENKCSSFEIQSPLEGGVLPKDGKPSDRSEVLKVEERSNSIKKNNKDIQATNDLCKTNDSNLYAHDTLDDSTADSFDLTSTNVKDEISAPDTVIPDVLRTDSHIDEELGISSSNASSAKSEFASFDQEVAKSMMTLLLPRALPLLNTFSRRKKDSVKPAEKSTHMSQEENKTDLHVTATCVSKLSENSDLEMKEKIEFPDRGHASVLPFSGHAESIIPDSFDNDEGGYVPDTELPQSCEGEADQISPGLDTRPLETKSLPDRVYSEENSLVCHDFQMDLCKNSKEDNRRSGTSIACRKAYVPASTENVPNTKNGCGVVSSETLIAEPILECVHLSETIICREFRDDCAAEACAKVNPSNAVHLSQGNDHDQSLVERNFCANEQKIDSSPLCSHMEHRVPSTNGVLHDVEPTLQNQENSRILDAIHNSDAHPTNSCQEISKFDAPGEQNFVTSPLSYMQNQRMDTYDGMSGKKHDNDDSNFTNCMDIENNKSELKGVFKFVACYVHPMPVSMVLVIAVEKEISICVLCVPLLQKERKIFIYKTPMTGQDEGNPSFVGYASLMLPFGRDIELDSTALQFSPHGQYLVLLNSIKAPCCREGDINCPCSECALDLEDNAVKIVQIKDGYASVIARLQSTKSVRCILVCKPHHLIAADDSGKLCIWVMNSKWSKMTEECFVQSPSCMPPLMELKRIPNFLHLVLGLHGFGEFSLWDINKRVLVSKFSSPHTSVFQCVPLSLFTWQAKCNTSADVYASEALDEIMDATKASFSEKSDNQVLSYIEEGDEVVVWLLVSTSPDLDKHGYQSSEPLRSWRLALLVKNTVIMGDVLEPSAAVVGASVGRGIIGRSDGQVYMWDLITGSKLGSLHHFKDASVSCIATTDDSQPGALAIASDGGQLLLYLPT